MSAPTLLLLDLDGVLRRHGPDDPVEDAHGLPRGALARVAFELAGPALVGEVPDERWREAIRDRLAADGLPRATAEAAVAAWTRPGTVVPEVLELVRRVRRRCRVALLTNATSRLPEDLRALGLDREVDAVVSSSRIGVAKPAPEAFRRALRVLQHSPSRTLFCDDDPDNAAAARSVGIDGVHVPDYPALHEALTTRGLLDDPAPTGDAPAPVPVLLVLHDRDEAEALADRLAAEGWAPCHVHKDLLAGEDDAEDADWLVELTTAPDGRPASAHRPHLSTLGVLY
ncbi:HAD-IA family hydrolase [Saccharothrix coeruleofusca]|uniref:Hydrolase of the HAD superfamily n=1 Tax=Saccharothrix coeruleofusca TaxID=33919 RepID=A0A918EGP2_9PSEU|nr:HAD-IA family hydrolase [Saccharothrix coeruleofusca]MBP2339162.1 HAD superfamily hydrolase (TIGR01509 family) [Saccharothrix coeruleofusca]GGP70372.1 hypothetical protein GCM10010185_49280 [Saccharothrix coeruleofusca]